MADIERRITRADVFLALPRNATDKVSCLGGRPVAPAEEIETGRILREELHAIQDPIVERRSESYAIIAAAKQSHTT